MSDDELKRLLEETVSLMRRHFDMSTEEVKSEIRLVSEAVASLEEKVDRENEATREEMRGGFSETQAMIRFSHAEIDRRVRTLESTVTDLLARVERLESSIH